jgi:hypothetical protein
LSHNKVRYGRFSVSCLWSCPMPKMIKDLAMSIIGGLGRFFETA